MVQNAKLLWVSVLQYWRLFSRYTPFPWSALKGVMSSKLARLTVIIPIVGWLLVYNDNLIILFENLLKRDLPNEFGWKVYVFYVGLFAISISSILFAIFCPNEIKSHSSIVDYVKHSRLIFTERYEKNLSKSIGREPFDWAKPPEAYANSETGRFTLVRKHSENEEDIVDTLVEDYHQRNFSWPLVRVCALVFFISGALLASVPTLSTVHWASCLVVKDTGGFFSLVKFENTCPPKTNRRENHLENVE